MPGPCCVVDTTTQVVDAINNGQNSLSFKFSTNTIGQDICINNQTRPSLTITLGSCAPDQSIGGYIYANGKDDSLLGMEKSVKYDEISTNKTYINPLRLNLVTLARCVSLPVKGSSLTMDFQLTYNSKSYIDVGNGWGWIHNSQLRLLIDTNGDLLLRGGTGTITRLPKVPDSSPTRWSIPASSVLDAYSYNDINGNWIVIRHKDGSKVQFLGMPGSDYVPIKTLDCQGRFFYYVYNNAGLLARIRTDYTSRFLEYEYDNYLRLIRVRDTTTLPTVVELEYYPGNECKLLKFVRVNGRVIHYYNYTKKGEINDIDSEYYTYHLNNPGYIEDASIYTPGGDVVGQSENDKCPDELTSNQQAKINYKYELPEDPKDDKPCDECKRQVHRDRLCFNGQWKIIVKFNEGSPETPSYGQIDGKLKKCEELLLAEGCDNNDCCDICEGLEYEWDDYGLLKEAEKDAKDAKDAMDSLPPRTMTAEYGSDSRQVEEIHIKPNTPKLEDQVTHYQYSNDECHGIISATNAYGKTTNIEYDEYKRLKRISKPDASFLQFLYDNDNQIINVANPSCSQNDNMSMLYNNDGLVTDLIAQNDHYHFTYDNKWNIISITGPSSSEQISYTPYGEIQSVTNEVGYNAEYQYDLKGRCVTKDENGTITSYQYLNNCDYLKSVSSGNNTTTYSYNDLGSITKIVNNNDVVSKYEYDDNNKLLQYTDEYGNNTTIEYNGGQIANVKTPDNTVLTPTYDSCGRVSNVSLSTGNSLDVDYYNDTNLIKKMTDSSGSIREYEYDDMMRISKITDENDYNISYTYSPCGIVKVQDSNGSVVDTTYDSDGNISSIKDLFGNMWVYNYIDNKLVSKKDPKNNTVTYEYDAFGKPIKLYWPDSNTAEEISWNDKYLPSQYQNSSGKLSTYTYDSMMRLINVTNSDNQQYVYTYNAYDDVTSIQDSYGINQYLYDDKRSLIQSKSSLDWITNYIYNNDGQIVSKTNQRGNYYYQYNNNRIISISSPGITNPISIDYLGNSNRINSITLPANINDIICNYTYNNDNYASIAYTKGNNTLTSIGYSYTDNKISTLNINSTNTNFTYDIMDQLTGISSNNLNTTYQYDSTYNCTSKTVGNTTVTYGYNSNDQLISQTNGNDILVYNYDTVGNMISKKHQDQNDIITYDYDDYGNLIQVDFPNGDYIELQYYGTGKRSKKIYHTSSDTITWTYYYDEGLPVKITKTNDDPTYFTFVGNGMLFSISHGENTYYCMSNQRGDITGLVDTNGNVVASYQYDAWGYPTITNVYNIDNPFLYQGSYATFFDPEISLYSMGKREYDPELMRFISRDINHGRINDTMSQNLYIYCKNNPINNIDANGFDPTSLKLLSEQKKDIYISFRTFSDPKMTQDICYFTYLWKLSDHVANRMQKYDFGNKNTDNDKGEKETNRSLSFWTCYYNSWLSMGLTSMDQVTSLSNLFKAIVTRVEDGGGPEERINDRYPHDYNNQALSNAKEKGFISNLLFDWVNNVATDKKGTKRDLGTNGAKRESYAQGMIGAWVYYWNNHGTGGSNASDVRENVINHKTVNNDETWRSATYFLFNTYGKTTPSSPDDKPIKMVTSTPEDYTQAAFDLAEHGSYDRVIGFNTSTGKNIYETVNKWKVLRGTGVLPFDPWAKYPKLKKFTRNKNIVIGDYIGPELP